MRKGITEQIEAVIDQVAQMESLKPYILCGGTALAMQIDHRKSEDLDFMMWRTSKSEKPEVDWPKIHKELEEKVGAIERFNMLGFDQVEFVVRGVKFSFYVSDRFCPVAKNDPTGQRRFDFDDKNGGDVAPSQISRLLRHLCDAQRGCRHQKRD